MAKRQAGIILKEMKEAGERRAKDTGGPGGVGIVTDNTKPPPPKLEYLRITCTRC
jgi:hypothetical protein